MFSWLRIQEEDYFRGCSALWFIEAAVSGEIPVSLLNVRANKACRKMLLLFNSYLKI